MEDRYVFIVEWFDQIASLVKKLKLIFYPSNNSLELFNIKTRKLFLKRSIIKDIDIKNIYIGSIINVYS